MYFVMLTQTFMFKEKIPLASRSITTQIKFFIVETKVGNGTYLNFIKMDGIKLLIHVVSQFALFFRNKYSLYLTRCWSTPFLASVSGPSSTTELSQGAWVFEKV